MQALYVVWEAHGHRSSYWCSDEEWKGYVVWISGGHDKQGLPMKQGAVIHGRVRLLLSKGHFCYRPRRTRESKRKSVHGCQSECSQFGYWEHWRRCCLPIIVRKPLKKVRSVGPMCPRFGILLFHMSFNTNASVLLWRSNELSKTRRVLQNMLNFWTRKKSKKSTRNRFLREVGYSSWELILLSESSQK